jgi:hypothetical protein
MPGRRRSERADLDEGDREAQRQPQPPGLWICRQRNHVPRSDETTTGIVRRRRRQRSPVGDSESPARGGDGSERRSEASVRPAVRGPAKHKWAGDKQAGRGLTSWPCSGSGIGPPGCSRLTSPLWQLALRTDSPIHVVESGRRREDGGRDPRARPRAPARARGRTRPPRTGGRGAAAGRADARGAGSGFDGHGDNLAQLKQLGDLRASGVLTDTEFEVQQANILSA